MNNVQTAQRERVYDLEERTRKFGIAIILLAQKIQETIITRQLISQLVRAGTSVGANYCEANEASSKKDFVHKIGICKKEAHEVIHWLRMIHAIRPENEKDIKDLIRESRELTLVFGAILTSAKKRTIEH